MLEDFALFSRFILAIARIVVIL